jgi:hypothetical protein
VITMPFGPLGVSAGERWMPTMRLFGKREV